MRRDFKSILIFILKMILVWEIAILFFYFIRNFGIEESRYFQMEQAFDVGKDIVVVVFAGVITGLFYSCLEILFDRPFFQKQSFWKLMVVKTVLYFIAFSMAFLFVVLIFVWLSDNDSNTQVLFSQFWGKVYFAVMFYFLIVSILVSFFLQVSQKLGPGMLLNLFIGKYHRPKEEERIFLFIDLHSSTSIAEQLGHVKFSRLLQDCFFDLTDVLVKHQVDIYQYVGDEAVLSWPKEKGIAEKRCIHAYFDFMKILKSRSDYYMENYGLKPFFKAGLHMGKVTVAEVGVIKKDIAYHGDVLNTTARIEKECNRLGQAILASEEVIKNMSFGNQFTSELLDSPILRGKQGKVNVYGVQPI